MANKEDFFGKEVYDVMTKFHDGKLTQTAYRVKVWTPGGQRTYCLGCDIIIDDSSCKSESIFEIGGIDKTQLHDFGTWQSLAIHNYCLPENLDEVKKLHLEKMEHDLQEFVDEKRRQLDSVQEVINGIEYD